MAERNPVAPDASMGGALNEPTITNGNATASGGDDILARLASIESQLGLLPHLQQQMQKVDRKADKLRDQIYGRMAKQIEAQEQAYRRVAAREGWDESTLNARLGEVRADALDALSTRELDLLNGEDPAAGQASPPPPAPVPPAAARDHAPHLPAAVQDTPPLSNPPGTLDAAQAHANALRAYLATLGLNEADMSAQGVLPYVLQAEGSEGHRRWLRDLNAALDRKEALARMLAERQEREGLARAVQSELEEYGDLGSTVTGGGGTPSHNANLLIDRELREFRGTGNVAEALQLKRGLEQRYKR